MVVLMTWPKKDIALLHERVAVVTALLSLRLRFLSTDEEKVRVQLPLRVAHLLLDLCHDDLAFLRRPSEHAGEETHGIRVDAVANVLALEGAHLFVAFAFGPGADGDLAWSVRVVLIERSGSL